jgi:predicted RNA binding protein YcfA (HicA-like mRNA interferase family)
MTYRQLIKLIEKDGWDLVKTKGSHRQFKHPTKKGKVTIPGKLGVDVPKGILKRILKQAGIK